MKFNSFLSCMILVFLLTGCTIPASDVESVPTLSNGLFCTVDTLPTLDQFSSTEYEDYNSHFSPVVGAVYHHNGIQEPISAEDPRLIRLLNFLAYSNQANLDAWRKGTVEEDELVVCINSHIPMLEVNLDNSKPGPGGGIHSRTHKLFICGDSYLLYTERTQTEGILQAEQYFPFNALIWDMVENGQMEESVLGNGNWGEVTWIDLLTYAGF